MPPNAVDLCHPGANGFDSSMEYGREDVRAEVRSTIEGGISGLQAWLDHRLKRQEDLMERLCKAAKLEDWGCTCWPPLAVQPSHGQPDSARPACHIDPFEAPPRMHVETPGAPLADSFSRTSSRRESHASRTSELVGKIVKQASLQSVPALASAWQDDEDSWVDQDEEDRGTAANGADRLQDWQSRLMELFDEIDLDGSGTIDRNELSEAFLVVGIPKLKAFEVFTRMDSTTNGEVDRLEWLHVIEQGAKDDADMFMNFAKKVVEHHNRHGQLYADSRRRKRFVIRHSSAYRMVWDVLLMVFVFYISVSLPFMLGFDDILDSGVIHVLAMIDRVLDAFFLVDVVLNFFTSYVDKDDCVVIDNRRIACNYLGTWFALDFVSSVPWEDVTVGLIPGLQAARIVKIGKIAKVFKLMRLGKILKLLAGSELMEAIEDRFSKRGNQTVFRILYLTLSTLMLCHWLACVLSTVGDEALRAYLEMRGEEVSASRNYLAAMYWAMATLTTVGYGDVVPMTDRERGYAMLAMFIGGSFYGYIIGCITSVISDMDLNTRAFSERMELLQAWLDYHSEIPTVLRRRIRRHFKSHLSNKTAVDDTSIVKDLSPDLRADAAYFLIHEDVRCNPLFRELPNSALASLIDIFERTNAEPGDTLCRLGDPGFAMYIIVDGRAFYREGTRWVPPYGLIPEFDNRNDPDSPLKLGGISRAATLSTVAAPLGGLTRAAPATEPPPQLPNAIPDGDDNSGEISASPSHCEKHRTDRSSVAQAQSNKIHPIGLKQGDSFGEEIIFALEETYTYTVAARTEVAMYVLSEDKFQERFKNLPVLMQQMRNTLFKNLANRYATLQ